MSNIESNNQDMENNNKDRTSFGPCKMAEAPPVDDASSIYMNKELTSGVRDEIREKIHEQKESLKDSLGIEGSLRKGTLTYISIFKIYNGIFSICTNLTFNYL